MNKSVEVYPNAPLKEAVFEIRFPGEPAIECHRDRFFNKIRKEYPELSVPRSMVGDAISLKPYLFEKSDRTASIGLSINTFFVSVKKYNGYNIFKKEVLKIVSYFREVFPEITHIKRTGLRYINIIPFTRETGIIPIENYLNINVMFLKSMPTSFKNFTFLFVSDAGEGNVTTRIEPALSPDKSEAIILDFDYTKEATGLTIESVGKYMDDSHLYTKSIFEDLLTANYKKYMKGDVI